jgi:hypothetical protein
MKNSILLFLFFLCINSVFAQIDLEQISISHQNTVLSLLKPSRIGVQIATGIGYENIPLFFNQRGEQLSLSTGGGYGGALEYGFQFNKYFELSTNLAFYRSELDGSIKNGDAYFTRLVACITPALIVPFGNLERFSFRLGAGLGWYSMAKMYVFSENSANYYVHYHPSMGFHQSLFLDYKLNTSSTFSIGAKNEFVKYFFDPNNSPILNQDAPQKSPDGSGLIFSAGYSYRF